MQSERYSHSCFGSWLGLWTWEYNIIIVLLVNKVEFIVDSLFYSSRFYLVSAAFFILVQRKIVGKGNFTSALAEDYRNLFVAELYRVLSFLVLIDYTLTKHKVRV